MQLRPPTGPAAPPDLATGLAACRDAYGQRPAVTQLTAAGRSEQGYVTLAQWAAKGAHLLLTDAYVAPGDRVLVDVPPGWPLAAVCAAVWWVGATVVVGETDDVTCAVVHESRPLPDLELVWVVGDAVDGNPVAAVDAPAWAEEVQLFPDQPPAHAARPDLPALADADGVRTHLELVGRLADARGTLGVDVATYDGHGVVEVAARPVVTGRTTLVLDGPDRDAAAGDRVTTWA